MADRMGQQLGDYKLIRLLGRGSFGGVYLGEHIFLKTLVTIKVLQVSPESGSQEMENFLNEPRLLFRLDHSNIERVLDFGIENTTPYLVTEYAPDGTLRNRHPRGSQLTIAQAVSYVKQIASALQYMHDQGLVHRDVKPENMLLGANGKVLLSDFGIATRSHASTSPSSQDVAGTGPYMAPEQSQGEAQPASDQYSLAVVVYEWLTGRPPFLGSFLEIFSQHYSTLPPSLLAINPSIPREVEEVVMIALSKNPQQRFASIQAFANALEQASNPGQHAKAQSPSSRSADSPIRSISPETLQPSLPQYDAPSPPGHAFAPESIDPPTISASPGMIRPSPPGVPPLNETPQVSSPPLNETPQAVPPPPMPTMPNYGSAYEHTGAFQSPSVGSRGFRNTSRRTSQRPSITKGLGNALKKITAGRKDNKQQAKELSLFAIARTTLENNNQAIVGNIYNIEAGISQNRLEGFRGEPIRIQTQNAVDPLSFDILIHPGDNIELLGALYQRLRYNPGSAEPQFITCPFRLKTQGGSHLIINFYRERQWLKAIRFEFEGILQPQSVMATSGR